MTFSNIYLQYNDYKLRLYGLGAVLTGPLTVNNSDSGSAFKVSYSDTPVMAVSNDGLIECQSLRLNYTHGLMIFSGLTKNVHVTNDGNMTTAGTIRMDGSNTSTTDAISLYDTATQTKPWSIKNNGSTVLKSLSLTGTLGIYATRASTPNIELNQNGRIVCNEFQLDNESGNGFKCYGVNTAGSRMLTSPITQNGAMTCTSLAITDRTPRATAAKATIWARR